jgi:hypothetical protein
VSSHELIQHSQPTGVETMSGVTGSVTPARRVRHDLRDGLAVMAFSASVSVGIAFLCLLLVGLGK